MSRRMRPSTASTRPDGCSSEDLFNEDVETVLAQGEIIENYDEAPPFEHVLLSGRTRFGLPLHVVIVVDTDERRLSIITTYEPDHDRWTDDYSRRR